MKQGMRIGSNRRRHENWKQKRNRRSQGLTKSQIRKGVLEGLIPSCHFNRGSIQRHWVILWDRRTIFQSVPTTWWEWASSPGSSKTQINPTPTSRSSGYRTRYQTHALEWQQNGRSRIHGSIWWGRSEFLQQNSKNCNKWRGSTNLVQMQALKTVESSTRRARTKWEHRHCHHRQPMWTTIPQLESLNGLILYTKPSTTCTICQTLSIQSIICMQQLVFLQKLPGWKLSTNSPMSITSTNTSLNQKKHSKATCEINDKVLDPQK